MENSNYRGKVVAVSAAASEPGRSIVLSLARCGARVIALDKDINKAGELATIAETEGGNVVAYELDVMKKGLIYDDVNAIVAKEGKVDVLINCEKDTVKLSERKPVHEMDFDRYLDVANREVIALYYTSKAFMQDMVAKKDGIIINVTSDLGLSPKKGVIANCATSAAVMSLSRVWALELRDFNVRVYCIARGRLEEEEIDNEEILHQSVGRSLTGEDVAGAVKYLMSDTASMANGCILTVDGGLHYGYMRNF